MASHRGVQFELGEISGASSVERHSEVCSRSCNECVARRFRLSCTRVNFVVVPMPEIWE